MCAFHGLRSVAMAVGRSTNASARPRLSSRHRFRLTRARTACNSRRALSRPAGSGKPSGVTGCSSGRCGRPPSSIWTSWARVVEAERRREEQASRRRMAARRSCSVDRLTASPMGWSGSLGGGEGGGGRVGWASEGVHATSKCALRTTAARLSCLVDKLTASSLGKGRG
jgi:hypothetical protein